MKVIWKYPLEIIDVQKVYMQEGSEILSVQAQHGKLCLWAICNSHLPDGVARVIEIIGTGNPVAENDELTRTYIGTAQMSGGALVWHVFERTSA